MSSNPFSILEEVGELGEGPIKVKETKKPEKKKTEKKDKPEKKEQKTEKKDQKKEKKPEKKEEKKPEKKQEKKQEKKETGKQSKPKNEKPAQQQQKQQQQEIQPAPTDDGFTQQTKKQKYNRRNNANNRAGRPQKPQGPVSSATGGRGKPTRTENGDLPRQDFKERRRGPRQDKPRGEPRRRGREFDRHVSGTGRGKELKKGGRGKFNWGTGDDEPVNVEKRTEFADKEIEEKIASKEETKPEEEKPQTEEKKEGETEEKKEGEKTEEEKKPEEMTLEEYKKLQQEKKKALLKSAGIVRPKARKAGEGVTIVDPKNKGGEEVVLTPEQEAEKKKKKKSKGRNKPDSKPIQDYLKEQGTPLPVPETTAPPRRGGRGGRGGRGRRGGRRGGFQGKRTERNRPKVQAPNLSDEKAFPSL